MQKLKALYNQRKTAIWELVRYVVAGALTTALSMVVSYGCYFLMAMGGAPQAPAAGFGETAKWVIAVINSASAVQVSIGNVIAWVIAVIFAFWINRWMVFRVKYHNQKDRFTAFFQFVSARVVSLLLFEVGFAALLNVLGLPNLYGRIIVLVLVMVFNYVASKFWVFKKKY